MFGRNRLTKVAKYETKGDDKPWNRNAILRNIADELQAVEAQATNNTLSFKSDPRVKITFISDQYSTDDRNLYLNGSIVFGKDDEEVILGDLITFAKLKYGDDYRALHIFKDQAWQDSAIQRETQEFYAPLCKLLLDPQKRMDFLRGEQVLVDEQTFQLPDSPWIQGNAAEALQLFTA